MYSKGISWIDDCRIPYQNTNDFYSCGWSQPRALKLIGKQQATGGDERWTTGMKCIGDFRDENKGRFPANILVSDDMLNDGNSGGSAYCSPTKYEYGMSNEKFNSGGRRTKTGIGDKGTNSRYYDIDKWFDKIIE